MLSACDSLKRASAGQVVLRTHRVNLDLLCAPISAIPAAGPSGSEESTAGPRPEHQRTWRIGRTPDPGTLACKVCGEWRWRWAVTARNSLGPADHVAAGLAATIAHCRPGRLQGRHRASPLLVASLASLPRRLLCGSSNTLDSRAPSCRRARYQQPRVGPF